VEDYLSEREQIDQVRRWIRENAPWAIAGVLLGVGLLVGWQQFGRWKENQSVAAAQKYTQTLDALSRNDKDAAAKLVQQLRDDYRKTPYADMAELALARFYVEDGKLPEAAKSLEAVMNATTDEELKLVARLRLARVQRAQGNADAALATLNAVQGGGYAPAFAEVRGDVLFDKGDRAGALAAYREAQKSKVPGLVDEESLKLKIDELGGADAPATVAATAPAAAAGAAP
jgi:predicted negative regulator of RcsB-dependent stress response